MRRKARLELTDPREIPAVMCFYEMHATKNVARRPARQQEAAARSGLHFKVVADDNEICAVSGAYPVRGGPYMELGNTLIAPQFRGFKLQQLLIHVRVATLSVLQPDDIAVMAIDLAGNPASAWSAENAGFVRWTEPVVGMLDPCTNCEKASSLPSDHVCCSTFLILGPEAQRRLARRTATAPLETTRVRREDAAELSLEIAAPVLRDPMLRNALGTYALRQAPRPGLVDAPTTLVQLGRTGSDGRRQH